MSVATPQPVGPKPKRCWYQFSLRTLLIFVTFFAIPCSWLAVRLDRAKKQKKAVEVFRALGFNSVRL